METESQNVLDDPVAAFVASQRIVKNRPGEFKPSEAVAIGRELEERFKLRRRHVADALEIGETSFYRMCDVVKAAEDDPEKFGDLLQTMDDTGNVYGTFQEMKRRRRGGAPDKSFDGKRKKRNGKIRLNRTEPYQPSTERQIMLANSQKDRMINSLSTVNGHCRGMQELDIPMVVSVCTTEEIQIWVQKAKDLSRTYRQFAAKLERGSKNAR